MVHSFYMTLHGFGVRQYWLANAHFADCCACCAVFTVTYHCLILTSLLLSEHKAFISNTVKMKNMNVLCCLSIWCTWCFGLLTFSAKSTSVTSGKSSSQAMHTTRFKLLISNKNQETRLETNTEMSHESFGTKKNSSFGEPLWRHCH